jgi:hypothetical protein
MGQASEFQPFDAAEFALAAQFVAERLPKVSPSTPVSLEQDVTFRLRDGSLAMVYPTSRTEDGTTVLLLNPADNAPLHGTPCSWLALLDIKASTLEMVSMAKLTAAIGAEQNQFFTTTSNGGWTQVNMAHVWMRDRVVVKSFDLGAGGSYTAYRAAAWVTSEKFVHLHVHSMYSVLDGQMTLDTIAQTAKDNGQPGVALTDHGNMFGTWKHYKACKKVGVKPILGIEAYLVDDVNARYTRPDGSETRFEYHQTLLAMNDVGWKNLCHLTSVAHRDHTHYVPRIDHNLLFQHNEGIICLTGCFKGMAAHYLQTRAVREGETELPWWLVRDPDRARGYLEAYQYHFGDRLYGECMRNDFTQYMQVVPELMEIFDSMGIPKVVTNDAHYATAEDASTQAMVAAIGGFSVGDGLGGTTQRRGAYYMKQRCEIEGDIYTGDMFDRTCEIMDRCDVNIDFKGYQFPKYDMTQDRDWAAFQSSRSIA